MQPLLHCPERIARFSRGLGRGELLLVGFAKCDAHFQADWIPRRYESWKLSVVATGRNPNEIDDWNTFLISFTELTIVGCIGARPMKAYSTLSSPSKICRCTSRWWSYHTLPPGLG